MQFLAVVRRRTEAFTAEEIEKYLDPEAEAIRTLYIQGVVRNIWSRGDELGAVLLIEADSLEQASAIVADFPLARQSMLVVEKIIPLRGYRGFGPNG